METTATQVRTPGDLHWDKFEQFQKAVGCREPSWLMALRKAGLSRFAETGFPTVRDEDWRFTNIAPAARQAINLIPDEARRTPERDFLGTLPLANIVGSKLVFVDGQYAAHLSTIEELEANLRVESLASAVDRDSEIIERYLGRQARDGYNPFAALNRAFFTDGALIHVPAGAIVQRPVQLLHISTTAGSGASSHLRHLVVAESDSQVTILETYISAPGATHFTNVVTELFVKDRARVEHCKFQDESTSGYHMAALDAELGAHCNVLAHSFALGARISRNNIRTLLGGEGIECILNGLYLTSDDQLADHHMIVEHAKPHCNSHEYFNGILDGRSRGVFHGRILVHPEAQKTDAKQTNKNLLLSDDAGVNTKPQLEIYADDVKCTHGATIGQLNDESVFYLRARGIGLENARRMLMHAFAGEIIARIRCEPLREELDQLVWNRLEQHKTIAGAH